MNPTPRRFALPDLAPLAISGVLLAGALLPVGDRVSHAQRSFQVLVLAALLAALGRIGLRLARFLAPGLAGLSRPVSAFVFASAWAVASATWLGHFRLLDPGIFLAATALAHLLAGLLPRGAEGGGGEAGEPEAPPPPAAWRGSARLERSLLLSALAAVALAGHLDLRANLYKPAGPHSFDDTSYHLSTVATWVRHGDLRMIRFGMGDPGTAFYPAGGELASWALLAPFRDSDVAARWSQLPFALFSFLAVAALARRLGLGNRDAALAALAYASLRQVFPVLAVGAGNDHGTSFYTLAALDGALAFAARPSRGLAVATGTALGLLLGTKYLGVLFAPVVLAVLATSLWLERRGRSGLSARALAGRVALLLLAAAAAGGYTYLRNAVATGNPVFPAPVRLFGVELFPGWEGALVSARRGEEPALAVWSFLTARPDLFGRLFPFTLLPAALLAPVAALARRRFREAVVFSLPAAFFLQFLFQTHDHRDLRYFLPGIAVAAVALAWLLAREGRGYAALRLAATAGLLLQVVSAFDRGRPHWFLWIPLFLAVGAGLELAVWTWLRRKRETASGSAAPRWPGRLAALARNRPFRLAAAAAALLLALSPLGRVVRRYQETKLDERDSARALQRVTGPGGARVAYAGFNQPYLFFGDRLQNDLQIVPRNRHLEAQYFDWNGSAADPYEEGSYRQWRANLEARRIGFVVVVREPEGCPEERWVRRRPGFELAYDDGRVGIWKVVPARAGASGPPSPAEEEGAGLSAPRGGGEPSPPSPRP